MRGRAPLEDAAAPAVAAALDPCWAAAVTRPCVAPTKLKSSSMLVYTATYKGTTYITKDGWQPSARRGVIFALLACNLQLCWLLSVFFCFHQCTDSEQFCTKISSQHSAKPRKSRRGTMISELLSQCYPSLASHLSSVDLAALRLSSRGVRNAVDAHVLSASLNSRNALAALARHSTLDRFTALRRLQLSNKWRFRASEVAALPSGCWSQITSITSCSWRLSPAELAQFARLCPQLASIDCAAGPVVRVFGALLPVASTLEDLQVQDGDTPPAKLFQESDDFLADAAGAAIEAAAAAAAAVAPPTATIAALTSLKRLALAFGPHVTTGAACAVLDDLCLAALLTRLDVLKPRWDETAMDPSNVLPTPLLHACSALEVLSLGALRDTEAKWLEGCVLTSVTSLQFR